MRKLIFLLAMLVIAVPAVGYEITLGPGTYLLIGKAADIRIESLRITEAPHRSFGVLLPNMKVLPLPGLEEEAVQVGRPTTIRGQAFTPIVVRPWVASVLINSSAPIAAENRLPTFPKKLAIITDNYYVEQLQYLGAYIAAKELNGWEVVVIADDAWNPSGLIGQPAADALRSWLAANYQSQGIGFVLLAGHPDPNYGLVPMKMVWPLKDVCDKTNDPVFCDMQSLPTDYYYSDLDGNWDLDGNGLAGEYPGDSGTGGVDFGPEVIVGRFPAQWDISMLDAYFYLATQYETATDLKGRNRVLLPGAMLGFKGLTEGMDNMDGATALDAIGNHIAETDGNLVFTRMFEEEGYYKSTWPNDYALSYEHLVNAFNYGHGLTIWFAHGYPTYTERMIWSNDADGNGVCEWNEYTHKTMLDSFGTDAFAGAKVQTFLWQISCLNGYPELEYNLGAMMLCTNSAGSICATRSAFGEYTPNNTWKPDTATGASETLAYYWAEKMPSGMPVGEALATVKSSVPLDGWDDAYPPDYFGYSLMGMGWHTKFNYNLYGDPTLVWKYVPGPHDSDWPWPDDDSGADDDSGDDDTTTDDDSGDDDSGDDDSGDDDSGRNPPGSDEISTEGCSC